MKAMKRLVLIVAASLVAMSCAGKEATGSSGSPPTIPLLATTTTDVSVSLTPDRIPDVDLSRASVPLDQVLFDTFDGRFVPLSEATNELVQSLRDAIPPIDEPTYGGLDAGEWLEPTDLILGYESKGSAYAYPIKILDLHEIVNDEIDGIPVLISYCPLCRSGIVYDRRVDGTVLDFGNTSALHESDLVMLDRQTGSFWWQVAGEAIVGTLTGARLTPLPSRVDTWEGWRERHPNTLVLEPPGGSPERYSSDRFAAYERRLDGGRFAFPVTRLDDRLPASELVIGIEAGSAAKAYPIETLGFAAINDTVDGTDLVVLSNGTAGGAVYRRSIDGEALIFEAVDGAYLDAGTQSIWDLAGRAVAGPLQGAQLDALPSRTTFWFAYAGAFPHAEVYEP